MLEADCLFGRDYAFLFDALGDTELSILAKIAFVEQMRGAPAPTLQNIVIQDLSILWQIELAHYFHELPQNRFGGIELRFNEILPAL